MHGLDSLPPKVRLLDGVVCVLLCVHKLSQNHICTTARATDCVEQVQNIFCFSSFFGCVVKKFDQSVFLEAIIKAKTFAQKRLRGDAGCLSCS